LERSRSEELIQKADELAETSKENARLQKELKNQVTGGDTKPILQAVSSQIIINNLKVYSLMFNIINEGKYPLHNLRATVMDLGGVFCAPYLKMEKIGGAYSIWKPKDYDKNDWLKNRKFDIGTLTPGNTHELYAALYSNDDKIWQNVTSGSVNKDVADYTIEIAWNGGKIIYYLTMTIKDDVFDLTKYEITFNGKPYHTKNDIKFIASRPQK